MEALRSYAKQAHDEDLEKLARKLRAQAMKRCGELIRELDGQGKRTDLQLTDATDGKLTQKEAAQQAGMSERQQITAVRIANVPNDLFDTLVESDTPPTITELAELGKKSNGPIIEVKNKDAFAPAIHFRGALMDLYTDYLEDQPPRFYLDGMLDFQKDEAKAVIPEIITWLNEFMDEV